MLSFSGNFDLQTVQLFILNGVALTISLVSHAVAKRWWQQSYALSAQQILQRFSEKANDHLVRLQHIASA